MVEATFDALVSLLVLVSICVTVVRPISVNVRGVVVTLDFWKTATLGVLVLRVLDVLPLRDIILSINRVGTVRPWAVLVIFFTLAYASISVDVTGVSKWAALSILKRFSSGNGNASTGRVKIVVVVYLLSGVIAFLASNDVVVLTLTPVLIHYCRAARIDPIPVLLAEYMGANTFSAFLLVGNPTNIIAAQGAGLTFASYFILLLAPTLGFIACSLLTLRALGNPSPQTPATAAGNPPVGDTTVAATSERMETTVPSAQANQAACVDAALAPTPVATAVVVADMSEAEDGRSLEDPSLALLDRTGAIVNGSILGTGIVLLAVSSYSPIPLWAVTSVTCALLLARDCFALSTDPQHPNERRCYQVGVRRMPWEIAPFAFSMFVIMGVLSRVGWTAAFGSLLLTVIRSSGVFGAAFWGLWLTVITMNVLNNQPATIFMVQALMELPAGAISAREFSGMLVSIILGSNVAACFTVPGALAGLMWVKILRNHQVPLSWLHFSVAGVRSMVLPVCVSAAVIFVQSSWFPQPDIPGFAALRSSTTAARE